jgi:hypothetical protein
MVGFVERTAAAAARLRDEARPDSPLMVFVDLAVLVNQLESCVPS